MSLPKRDHIFKPKQGVPSKENVAGWLESAGIDEITSLTYEEIGIILKCKIIDVSELRKALEYESTLQRFVGKDMDVITWSDLPKPIAEGLASVNTHAMQSGENLDFQSAVDGLAKMLNSGAKNLQAQCMEITHPYPGRANALFETVKTYLTADLTHTYNAGDRVVGMAQRDGVVSNEPLSEHERRGR